jgi:catecholate siderophore receptor
VGGSVNLVSKRAHLGDAGKLSAGIGTDNYKRLTADVNRQLNDTSAVRVNLMKHYNAVSERDEVDYDRWGLATSFGFGLGTDTRLWLDAFYQKDRNTPDGGVPIQRGTDGKRMPGVDRDAWYGDSSLYTQRSETRSLTGLFEHDFSDDLTLRNQLRWQQTDNWAVLSPARFVAANADGSRTCTGTRCASLGYVGPAAQLDQRHQRLHRLRQQRQWLRLPARQRLRPVQALRDRRQPDRPALQPRHRWHSPRGRDGVELYRETYGGLHKSMKVPDGSMFFNLSDPAHSFASTRTDKGYGDPRSVVKDAALYASDTLTLDPQWQLLLALRYDHWQVDSERSTGSSSSRDDAFGGRAGVVYKPLPNGSIYLSYSQAAQPSAVGASTNNQIYGAASTEAYKPAVSKTYELGTKWELLDERLNLTAALFRTELEDSWEYSEGETSPVRALPAKRVDGLELGLQGQLTQRWSAYAGFAAMKSRQTKGANKGEEAKNVPDLTANLWTTYDLTDQLSVSYGADYVGRRRYSDNKYVGGLNNNSSYANGPTGVYTVYTRDHEKAPSYWLHSLAARQGRQPDHAQPERVEPVQHLLLQPRRRLARRLPAVRRAGGRAHPDRQRGLQLLMLVQIANLFSADELREVRQQLLAQPWVDGKATAGVQSAQAKHNRQLDEDDPVARQLGGLILQRLSDNPLFMSAALPKRIYPPLFNRYGAGEGSAFTSTTPSAASRACASGCVPTCRRPCSWLNRTATTAVNW